MPVRASSSSQLPGRLLRGIREQRHYDRAPIIGTRRPRGKHFALCGTPEGYPHSLAINYDRTTFSATLVRAQRDFATMERRAKSVRELFAIRSPPQRDTVMTVPNGEFEFSTARGQLHADAMPRLPFMAPP